MTEYVWIGPGTIRTEVGVVGNYNNGGRLAVSFEPSKYWLKRKKRLIDQGKIVLLSSLEPQVQASQTSQTEQAVGRANLEYLTVAELTDLLTMRGVEIPPKTRKAGLIELAKELE